MDEILSKFD